MSDPSISHASGSSSFQSQLAASCKKNPKILALPESKDLRTLQAAKIILEAGACRSVVFGSSRESVKLIDSEHDLNLGKYSNKILYADELMPDIAKNTKTAIENIFTKKKKSVDQSAIETMANSPLYQAGHLISQALVNAVVSGAVHSTGDVIRSGLTMVGLEEGIKTISGSFIMEKNETIYLYSDAAVVVDPTPSQLCDIASESVKTWNSILNSKGEPVVAFLSFSTKGSAKSPMTEKVIEGFKMFSSKHPEICADGEIQFDAAFDTDIGKKKAPDSQVPGRANIFIFPNLDSGNICYKVTQRLAGFRAYGPILQGLRLPFCDLSRGATANDIAVTSYITMLKNNS